MADLDFLAGLDNQLPDLLRVGGSGCITATTNLGVVDHLVVFGEHDDRNAAETVAAAQARIDVTRTLTTQLLPQISSIKALLASLDDEGWLRVRPPLVKGTMADVAQVGAMLRDRTKGDDRA